MTCASAGEGGGLTLATDDAWKDGRRPKVPVHTFRHRRKSTANPWVGLLAWKERIATCLFAGRFTFPGGRAEWLSEATHLHSQWRDRAGFSPDFPFMPSWHPRQGGMLTHHVGARSNQWPVSATSSDRDPHLAPDWRRQTASGRCSPAPPPWHWREGCRSSLGHPRR